MWRAILKVLLFLFVTSEIFSQNDPAGRISGLVFGDYFYNFLRDSSINDIDNKALFGDQDLNGFQFRRINLTYDYDISEQFTTRFRIESQTIVGVDNTVFVIFVKDAFIKWKNIFGGSNLILGIQPPPSFDVAEDYWGFRSLEKTILDLRRIASSRDFGVSLKGKLVKSGVLNYWIMYGNGSTFESEADNFKRAYAHLDLKPSDELRLTIYSDYRFRPKKEFAPLPDQSFTNAALTTDFFIGYKKEQSFSGGIESFLQVNYNDVLQSESGNYILSNRNALGVSVFGWYKLSDLLVGIGRYDYFEPNISEEFKGDSRNYFILGLSFILHKNVSVTPNIQLETFETPESGIEIEPSLTGRITFYYAFQ